MKLFQPHTIITILILLCSLAAGVAATTIIAESGTMLAAGETRDFTITADSLPDGLSGYNITISLTDPSRAEIVGFTRPTWSPAIAGLKMNSTVPADTLWIKAVDFGDAIQPGATNVLLATVSVRGDATGTTNLTVSVTVMDPEGSGAPIVPAIQQGVITIGTPPPTTTVPTTTPTTVPTTTVTTTVTTTPPTTVPTTTSTTVPTTTVTTTVPTTAPTTPPPAPGTLTVYSFPLGADVALNGVSIGATPIINKPVAAGTYTLAISLAGYQTYTTTVVILPDHLTKVPLVLLLKGTGTPTTTPTTVPTTTLTTTATTTVPTTSPTTQATTVPTTQPTSGGLTGAILVSSSPSGATILVDGLSKGVTSAMVQGIPVGTHTVTLEKSGYMTETRLVTVNAGSLTRMPLVVLVPGTPSPTPTTVPTTMVTTTSTTTQATTIPTTFPTTVPTTPPPPGTTGAVSVISYPMGVSVYIDGVLSGHTPGLIEGISPGTHSVRFTLPGYLDKVTSVNVQAGATTNIPFFFMQPDISGFLAALPL